MRISDWSSDVCSSDLTRLGGRDKAWLERAGKPLVLALARRLAPEVVATLVSANRNADHYLSHGLRAIHDRIADIGPLGRSEEHTSELQLLMRISYAVFCLQNKNGHRRKPAKDRRHCLSQTIHHADDSFDPLSTN